MKVSLFAISGLVAQSLAAPSFLSAFENDAKSLSNNHRGGDSIIDKLREHKDFSMFVKVLERERGLTDDLDGSHDATVFAPTNDAMKQWEKEHKTALDDADKIRDIVRYHVALDAAIKRSDMHGGALVPTSLKLKSLGDRHQRVRVFRFADTVFLNGASAVVGAEIEAGKGIIHAVSRVLAVPPALPDAIAQMPTVFSTFSLALERTGLACDLAREKSLTAFAPHNDAWMSLGFQNLAYLFSCAGQETTMDEGRPKCKGVDTLKQLVRNHIATELAYSTDIIHKERITLRTLGKTDINVCAVAKGHAHKRDAKHADVRDYNMVVNKGEARIMFNDGLAANGAVQVIDNVLIGDVKLPFESGCGSMMAGQQM